MQGKEITFKLRFPTAGRQIEFDLNENESFGEVALISSEQLGLPVDKIEFSYGPEFRLQVTDTKREYISVKGVLNQVKGRPWREGDPAEITAAPIYFGA